MAALKCALAESSRGIALSRHGSGNHTINGATSVIRGLQGLKQKAAQSDSQHTKSHPLCSNWRWAL